MSIVTDGQLIINSSDSQKVGVNGDFTVRLASVLSLPGTWKVAVSRISFARPSSIPTYPHSYICQADFVHSTQLSSQTYDLLCMTSPVGIAATAPPAYTDPDPNDAVYTEKWEPPSNWVTVNKNVIDTIRIRTTDTLGNLIPDGPASSVPPLVVVLTFLQISDAQTSKLNIS